MTPAESAALTDADRIEYLTNQLRYYRDLSLKLHDALMATKNKPEKHDGGRGQFRDKTGDTAARNADKQRRKKRK